MSLRGTRDERFLISALDRGTFHACMNETSSVFCMTAWNFRFARV